MLRDAGNATAILRGSYELAVIRADDGGVEAALELLGVLFFTQTCP